LYILVNVAAGNLHHKIIIMNSQTIIANVVRLLHHVKPQMRIGALWVVINLTWPDDPESIARRDMFKTYGFPEVLTQQLEKEENIDVSERIKTALSNFNPRTNIKDSHDMAVDDESSSGPILLGSVFDDDNGDYTFGEPV
jgi:hypothetical protein